MKKIKLGCISILIILMILVIIFGSIGIKKANKDFKETESIMSSAIEEIENANK